MWIIPVCDKFLHSLLLVIHERETSEFSVCLWEDHISCVVRHSDDEAYYYPENPQS